LSWRSPLLANPFPTGPGQATAATPPATEVTCHAPCNRPPRPLSVFVSASPRLSSDRSTPSPHSFRIFAGEPVACLGHRARTSVCLALLTPFRASTCACRRGGRASHRYPQSLLFMFVPASPSLALASLIAGRDPAIPRSRPRSSRKVPQSGTVHLLVAFANPSVLLDFLVAWARLTSFVDDAGDVVAA
jgi:hypothetical protein